MKEKYDGRSVYIKYVYMRVSGTENERCVYVSSKVQAYLCFQFFFFFRSLYKLKLFDHFNVV